MKPIFKQRALLGGILFAALSSTAPAAMIFVDFGRTDNQTTGNYNNVHGAASVLATPSLDLIDSAGAATGVKLNTDFALGGSFAGTGADYSDAYPAGVADQPSAALIDSMFIRAAASTSLTLADLDSGSSYEIVIYGARGNNGGANTEWTLTDGNGSSTAGYDVFNNSTNVATFSSLVPDESNEISIFYTTTDDGSRPRGAINFMQITSTPVPEPSSSLFLMLSSGVLLVRRRKN
ncbi:PEP-CTERM sorting domain-containing protein [bacterium]|nr:PEP-CTERM sorting domain-containing protein [bacterium]